ncbi:hypothetical protein Pelo_2103 [Pelomyxa schiedti]|nr:hypothetical protein Pelo_2103 [Pelomyxa schiedti]
MDAVQECVAELERNLVELGITTGESLAHLKARSTAEDWARLLPFRFAACCSKPWCGTAACVLAADGAFDPNAASLEMDGAPVCPLEYAAARGAHWTAVEAVVRNPKFNIQGWLPAPASESRSGRAARLVRALATWQTLGDAFAAKNVVSKMSIEQLFACGKTLGLTAEFAKCGAVECTKTMQLALQDILIFSSYSTKPRHVAAVSLKEKFVRISNSCIGHVNAIATEILDTTNGCSSITYCVVVAIHLLCLSHVKDTTAKSLLERCTQTMVGSTIQMAALAPEFLDILSKSPLYNPNAIAGSGVPLFEVVASSSSLYSFARNTARHWDFTYKLPHGSYAQGLHVMELQMIHFYLCYA